MNSQNIVLVLGPTGAGKTSLSLCLASAYDGGVINVDSRQVYADFPLITAQPTQAEQALCPHRLYGFLPCGEKITAGAFSRYCHQTISEIEGMGLLPLLVGGTGLYVRALLDGLAPIPEVPQEVSAALAAELEQTGLPALRARLEHVDAPYAATIHPNDKQRTLRALEVWTATGKPLSWWHAHPPDDAGRYRALKLGVALDLDALEVLLARRIDVMLEAGALDEARAALKNCPDTQAPAWSGIGCAELLRHLQGELSLEEAKALWLRNTRAYAKRQMTWFRKDTSIVWVEPGEQGQRRALEAVCRFLGKRAAG